MTDVDAIEARWRASCRAAGVKLTEDDIARARAAGALEQVVQREALLARLDAWGELPDYLDRGALERGDRG